MMQESHSSSSAKEERNIPTFKKDKETDESVEEKDDFKTDKRLKIDGLSQVVATHYNKLEEKGLRERNMSRIVYMRNFNNWIKSIFLSKFIGQIREESHDDIKIIALDMCCGKGGDLMKWQKANIRHLICADIAETSISQCKERYEHLKKRGKIFSAEFVVADCTKTRLKQHLEVPEKKLDIVSCQFAFHYCFESLSQAETMIRNVSDVLRKGGYFIATIPDANKILSKFRSAGSNSFGNEVFKIEFPESRLSEPSLFGDTYNFFLEGVVNCPEFLVHFPTLVRICKKYDLELVYNKSFEELYETGVKDRENRSLLFRMKALEMYPAVHGANLSSSNEEEYCHVGEDSKERNTSSVKTMSKSEWEAICLYMAFAFKKVT
ncbi:UNVERIFIED_CONTAM: hypothetical protein RMT77_009371 [Armadillidium vulgare]